MLLSIRKDIMVQWLIEVDDGVSQLSLAFGVIALPTSLMLMVILSSPHLEISHVVSVALLALLKIVVSVKL